MANNLSHSDSESTSPAGDVDRRDGRIVKKMPAWEPLEAERRYVQPHTSHVSVFTGFFSWAIRANRLGRNARRPVKLDSNRSTRERVPEAGRFSSYFSLGTGRDLRPRDSGHELNIHRNRVLFLGLLTAVVMYTLVWMTS